MIVVEADREVREIPSMLTADPLDQLFRRDLLLLRLEHDRRAVGVVGADVIAQVAAAALVANPDIGLDVFHQVADVNGTVGVGQRAGNENLSGLRRHASGSKN